MTVLGLLLLVGGDACLADYLAIVALVAAYLIVRSLKWRRL